MKRYNYTYLVDNKEVDKRTFETNLMEHCMKCDTRYDNPLLNISYLDEKKYRRYYRRLKEQRLHTVLFCSYNNDNSQSFRIIRKEVK